MTVSQPKMKEERKRHTKPCRFFQTGTCPLSAAHCNFAHIFSSIMPPDVHHSAQFCRFYDAGYCRNGNSCRFRHDPQYYLPIAVDPNWINAPPLLDTGYIPTQYISPYAPPLPVTNAVSYLSPFWLSESYPQFPPPLPPPSQYHPEELYSPVLQPGYISRSNSMDSSSVTSSLATVSDHHHLNNFQVMGGAPVVEDPLNKPECIVVPVDHCAGSTLFIGSSGIPKAQLQNIQTTSDDNSSKLHSNVERKPYKTVASVCRARSPAQSLDYSHSARVYKPPRKRTISNPSRVPPVLDSIGVYPAESP